MVWQYQVGESWLSFDAQTSAALEMAHYRFAKNLTIPLSEKSGFTQGQKGQFRWSGDPVNGTSVKMKMDRAEFHMRRMDKKMLPKQ
jgi:hypothetical protein